jgi:hypothetical protein
MSRYMRSPLSESGYDDATLRAVWSKGLSVPGYNSSAVRQDAYGNWIKFDEYGQQSNFGWEVDHRIPKALGGPDSLSNLQPLHWRANRSKADR